MSDSIQKFVTATEGFMEKVSEMVEEYTIDDGLKVEKATQLAELIYKIMQTAKLMQEGKKKGTEKDEGYKPTRSFVDIRAGSNNSDNGTHHPF